MAKGVHSTPSNSPWLRDELPGRARTETEFPALIRELSHLYFLSQNDCILRCFTPLCPGLPRTKQSRDLPRSQTTLPV